MRLSKLKFENGFTVLELMITILGVTVLMGAVMTVYLSCFRAFNAGEGRAHARTQLSQAVDIITRDLSKAQSIAACNSTTLTFYADLGNPGDPSVYNYILLGNTLEKTSGSSTSGGRVIASGIQTPSTSSLACSLPAPLFSCSNGSVTVDMTALNNGESVHVRTHVTPRNIFGWPVGWWKFDDVYPTVTGTCSTVIDSSGNGYSGTCNGGPTWTSGNTSGVGALSFNGSGNYVSVVSNSNLNFGTNPFSISLWFNGGSQSNEYPAMISNVQYWGSSNNSVSFAIRFGNTGYTNRVSVHWYPTDGLLYSSTLSQGTWNHVVFVRNLTSVTLYINGALVMSGTVPSTDIINLGLGGNMVIGGGTWDGGNSYYHGSIDDVRVYNTALTASQILLIYQGKE